MRDPHGEAPSQPLFQPSRRLFLGMGAATGAAVALQPVLGAAPALAGSGDIVDGFAAPARAAQAKFRWWWPHGFVDTAEIEREIDQVADAGFGGLEVADVHHSVTEDLDPENTGWGTPAWVGALEAALTRAEKRGVILDITIGPAWPAAVPTVTPQDKAAMRELAHGLAFVSGGEEFSAAVPEPVVEPAEGVTERTLTAVQVARLADGASTTKAPYALVADTVEEVTDRVEDDHLTWTPPDEGTWAVISYWERGSGQRPERGPHSSPLSYVVDHFGAAGTKAVTDFWEEAILNKRVRKLLKGKAGGALFEDSIEMETEATLWTPSMREDFERYTGYALMPYLPLAVRHDEDRVFSFDSVTDRRLTDDYNEVLSELYIEHHLKPLKKWAAKLGLQYRIQPYGLQTDAVSKAALVDIPEGESLGFKNLDDFRSLAGGRDLGGNTVLSSEAGAVNGGSYSTTWARTVRTISREYAAGVNQAVLHGFSYADAPGAQWPGFAAFTPYSGGIGYSESWGPRLPSWRHAADVSGFLARAQFLLRSGTSTADVAFLRQKGYAGSGFGAAYFSKDGVRAGWTHQFVSPRLLELTDPKVKKKRLAPDGPAYRLLVFEGDAFSGRVPTLPLETARRLLDYARDGLPIIVVGDWSVPESPGVDQGDSAELAEVVADLLAQPGVHRAPDREGIAAGIDALGVSPAVTYAKASPLLHAKRRDKKAELYYFANSSDTETVDHEVTISTDVKKAYPYSLDLWTGDIEPVAVHTAEEGKVTVRVRLAPGAATAIALADRKWVRNGHPKNARVSATDADTVLVADQGHVVRAAKAGTYTTTYDDGGTVSTEIAEVAEPVELTGWTLEVEDWRPGASTTETDISSVELSLDALKPWTELPDLADVSGLGRYTATVDLGEGWTGGFGAYLELGQVTDSFRVTVNGEALPPVDQLARRVDVGPYLRKGKNTVEVEVATTLINRMRVFRPDVYGSARRQECGLMGPVRLVPYGQAGL
ncbi:glycosyl hydrolase [Actinorugispora endophytica]|uniref:Alpha-L-rhamnosidase-like protein n=1 Tax=Actinorugispora endophytica TaxID=1605990 RepID=A0A4R6V3C4_9ACTN|nr:glycosyl hydrolase [Actinorugispora endophytica]TDQ53037.1 alpha-L-rhamnosidase-like protein [Actinorugispora endophytica]